MRKTTKRSLSVAIATAAMVLAVAGQAILSSAETVSLLGDATVDGTVSVADCVSLAKHLTRETTLTAQGAVNSDMNSDQAVNAIDLTLLKRRVLTGGTQTTGDNWVTAIAYASGSVALANANGETVAPADAENVTVANNTYVTIVQPGEYNISGDCAQGQLNINCDKTTYAAGQVTCNLLGLTLGNSSDSPLYVTAIDDECVLTVKNGYTNTISDGTSYTNADGGIGAIYACDDLKIKGKGTLIVNGNCEDGIVCKNDLKIWNGNLQVTAVDDGIRGKDSVRIGDPDATDYADLSVTVTTTNGDGIKSTEETDSTKGLVRITGGAINIHAHADAIQSTYAVEINGGTLDLYTYTGAGTGGQTNPGGWNPGGNTTSNDVSAKGIKVGDPDLSITGTMTIAGGTITADCTDDTLHAGGKLNITGGLMNLKTGDDGVHADDVLTISGGEVNVLQSYEGFEAYDLELKGGIMRVVASDDGINAAGGNDSSGTVGGWNPGGMSSSTGICNISGGYLYVRAGGDGLDSNGNLTISDGTIIVCGPTRGGNGIFDKGDGNYKLTFTGGTVFGIGTSDMMETPTASNGTYLMAKNVSLQAGNLISAADVNGNVVAVLKVPSDMTMTGAIQFYSVDANSNTKLFSGGNYSGTLNSDGFATGGSISGTTAISTSTSTNPWG